MADLQTAADVVKKIGRMGHASSVKTASDLALDVLLLQTGVFAIDYALFGGLGAGRQIQVVGEFSSGKTWLAYKCIAAVQRYFPGSMPVFIDIEGTFSPVVAAAAGMDLSVDAAGAYARFHLIRQGNGEIVADIVDELLTAYDCLFIVLDSLPMMVPLKLMEKSAEDDVVALIARLVGRMVTKALVRQTDARNETPARYPILYMINQYRSSIGSKSRDPRAPACGKALSLTSSMTIDISGYEKRGKSKETGYEGLLSTEHTVRLKKNKVTGTSMYEAKFEVVRDPLDPRGIGFVDQFATVATQADEDGLFVPNGNRSKWACPAFGLEGLKKIELQDWFEARPNAYLWLQRELIARNRALFGMEPEGWFYGVPPVPEAEPDLAALPPLVRRNFGPAPLAVPAPRPVKGAA